MMRDNVEGICKRAERIRRIFYAGDHPLVEVELDRLREDLILVLEKKTHVLCGCGHRIDIEWANEHKNCAVCIRKEK